jgi:hypothetical protein
VRKPGWKIGRAFFHWRRAQQDADAIHGSIDVVRRSRYRRHDAESPVGEREKCGYRESSPAGILLRPGCDRCGGAELAWRSARLAFLVCGGWPHASAALEEGVEEPEDGALVGGGELGDAFGDAAPSEQ